MASSLTSKCSILAFFLTVYAAVQVSVPVSGAVTERISVSAAGEGGNGWSAFSTVSSDGRYVVFDAYASNLVTADTNHCEDVFVRDRLTGEVERASVASDGTQANGISHNGRISPNGRYVTFCSSASNLVSGDTNDVSDAFIHDRYTGLTERVSVSSTGEQGNGACALATTSADGRFVCFASVSTNFAPDDTNVMPDIFVRDRTAGTTSRVSNALTGHAGNSWCNEASISADGSCITFVSASSNLVSNDTNASSDVFAYDMASGLLKRVSVSSIGVQANGDSQESRVSADGRYVVFQSLASNLVAGDTNDTTDIFVFDSLTAITERVSVSSSGQQGFGPSYNSCISSDGRYIAFGSNSTNFVPNDTNGFGDAFVRDRVTGITERVSVSSAGEQANGGCSSAGVSDDGRCVTYTSGASNLAPAEANTTLDVFLRDRLGSGYTQPQNISVWPSRGTPGTIEFTFVSRYRDANGFADIRRCYMLVNDSLTQSNAALFYYDRPTNRMYLKNDANTSWGTGYAPGTAVTLQNSQCSLYLKDCGVALSGDEITVNWRVQFKEPFCNKQLRSYLYVQDMAGQTDGWEQMGAYFNIKSEAVGITPSTGQIPMDTWVTLTSYYRDNNGWEDLRKCYLLINDSLAQNNALFLYYDAGTGKVYLKNDSNTSWGVGYVLGSEIILENSQCMLHVGSTCINRADNSLAVTWSFLLKGATMAGKNLYSWIYASDVTGDFSGYKRVGTHFTPVAPVCHSLAPNSGYVNTGVEETFVTVYSDPNGYADIYKAYLQLSVTSSQANAVLLMYDAKQNKVYLKNDANNSWGSGGVPGTATILENSQCRVNLASMATPSGPTAEWLSILWPIELKPSMAGRRLCERMFVQDNALLNSGWHVMGYVRTP